MERALLEAHKAAQMGEIPVGAVIFFENTIIAAAHNSNRSDANPTRHAEIAAIEVACAIQENERLLPGSTLYVTKEPCCMCAGAIVHARISTVVIGARDVRFGACGTALDVCGNILLNHRPEIIFGIKEAECQAVLSDFFKQLRAKKK